MDYKKEFEEACKLLSEFYPIMNDYTKERIANIVPGLRKSKDEEIRKFLIDYFQQNKVNGKIRNSEIVAWLEKQVRKSIKVYRVENEEEQKGLWRKFDGTWEPMFDKLTEGKCRDLPMDDSPIYREDGKQWFASAPSKYTLQKWFSRKDLEELTLQGFTILEFEVNEYKGLSDYEYIFTRDSIVGKTYLSISDIYPDLPVERSEEEKARIDRIIDVLDWAEEKGRISYSDWEDYVCYVKCLRPQSQWMPSNEQMEALDDLICAKYPNIEKYGAAVKSLYQDLKKLREK